MHYLTWEQVIFSSIVAHVLENSVYYCYCFFCCNGSYYSFSNSHCLVEVVVVVVVVAVESLFLCVCMSLYLYIFIVI